MSVEVRDIYGAHNLDTLMIMLLALENIHHVSDIHVVTVAASQFRVYFRAYKGFQE